jgi:hypothetical protein
MNESKGNRVPIIIRLDDDLHRALVEIVRQKYDDGNRRASINAEIGVAVRQMLRRLGDGKPPDPK